MILRMPIFHRCVRGGVLALLIAFCARADVTLPTILAEHMVIQRGLPVHIWGAAGPGENVSVSFRGETRSAAANPLGRWSLYLPPGDAGGPFELTVKAANTIALTDVLVGDVWVASGQSNMELPVSSAANAHAEIASANFPRIRLFQALDKVSDYPLDDIAARGSWAPCSPETVARFSAVAYYFARHLQQKLNVPIGLIETDWGGTPADSWTSLHALSADAALMPVFAEWARLNDNRATVMLERQKQERDWARAAAKARSEGAAAPPRQWQPNGNNSWMPAGLFNAMIAPLTPFPIRGVIWYQGESNTSPERAPIYARLFQTMIRDWRRAWGQGDFPFLFVQLANFKTSPQSMWPEVRDAQRQTLALANTGMAVIVDIGDPDNIHPTDKQDVGLRLAFAARAIAYGEKIEFSGPLFREATPEAGGLRVWFDHAQDGLNAKGGDLQGFEIAGADRKFVPAAARIDGAAVVVSSPDVTSPVYVRYGWADNPACNLYNSAGLPASPFRSGE
jgi:sialate O-acetylesterase